MSLWTRIANPSSSPPISTSKRIRAYALSCLAFAHWDLRSTREEGPEVCNIDSVYRAASCANECAALGFVSPIVLIIGSHTQQLLADEDNLRKFPRELGHPRFKAFGDLWDVVARRESEMVKTVERREERVARMRNVYVCAAEGCGLEGTSKSGLMRCAGKCEGEGKPSYCSKECQKTVSILRSVLVSRVLTSKPGLETTQNTLPTIYTGPHRPPPLRRRHLQTAPRSLPSRARLGRRELLTLHHRRTLSAHPRRTRRARRRPRSANGDTQTWRWDDDDLVSDDVACVHEAV